MASEVVKTRKLANVSAQQTITIELLSRIGSEWKVGDRLPPVKELANQLGAGESNTYLAVRELASEGVLDCRQRRGTFVVRLPESKSHKSAKVERNTIQGKRICIYQTTEPLEGFVRQMIDSFRKNLANSGAILEVRTMPESRACDSLAFENSDCDAAVLFNPLTAHAFVPRSGQHLVVVAVSAQHVINLPECFDIVAIDDHHGGVLAGQAFAKSGMSDVCFIGRGLPPDFSRYDPISSTRLYGLEAGLDQLIDPDNLFVVPGYSPISGGKAFRRYFKLNARPQCIFAASDDLAIGFIAAAEAQGLHAGVDYQIIGFDGQVRGQMLEEGALSTIQVPTQEMGRRAAQLLVERFNCPSRPNHRLLLDCTYRQGFTAKH